jgi:hypothetical protein
VSWLVLLAGCSSSEGWTVEHAEEVTNVRGLTVRVLQCRGLGRERDGRYERFACRAGARAPGEPTETVAVLYELHVRDSGYELRNVRFFGGPGIP